MGKKKPPISIGNYRDRRYRAFHRIDGSHPLKSSVSNMHVEYPSRVLPHGQVVYFNYDLAREMGLISPKHPNKLTPDLEKAILHAFNLRIINEYDQQAQTKTDPTTIKSETYMATRYLQLQHRDRLGIFSGDGRSIWNGVHTYQGKTWDISSRGTGATRLSPAFSAQKKFIKTGDGNVGYGCGTADLDEMLSSALLSEIFHRRGIPTERMLAVIDSGKGCGIGVRAHFNLIRPAHFFRLLKQGDWKNLKALTDYYIERQWSNKSWDIAPNSPRKYEAFLSQIVESFSRLCAVMEEEYIFHWLDWDGDNLLTDGSILDYGSVRQFGLKHDEYRYDDTDRFSTCLKEQKDKARYLVQVFAQMVDYLRTKKRKPLSSFSNHPAVERFREQFIYYRQDYFLFRCGFDEKQRDHLTSYRKKAVEKFQNSIHYFEAQKTTQGQKKTEDGVNRFAIFRVRDILSALPKHFLEKSDLMPVDKFFEIVLSSFATPKDMTKIKSQEWKATELQLAFRDLFKTLPLSEQQKVFERAKKINRPDRITGDAVIHIIEKIHGNYQRKKITGIQLQDILEKIIHDQAHIEGKASPTLSRSYKKLYLDLVEIVETCREGL